MPTSVYPGTFDPITRGHMDLVQRAARLFERVVVAVADNPNKQPLFPLDERVAMARSVLKGWQNVEVKGFHTLLVDFARKEQVQVIIRGLRAVSDFEYEIQLAEMNRRLEPEIETLFLSPASQYGFVSSSLVKQIAKLGGDVSPFVHEEVSMALSRVLSKT